MPPRNLTPGVPPGQIGEDARHQDPASAGAENETPSKEGRAPIQEYMQGSVIGSGAVIGSRGEHQKATYRTTRGHIRQDR